MTHKSNLGFALCVACLAAGARSEEKAPAREGWKLVWQDEFEGQGLDPEKWNVLLRAQSKHGELLYYVPDEVYVVDGCLRLRSRVRRRPLVRPVEEAPLIPPDDRSFPK